MRIAENLFYSTKKSFEIILIKFKKISTFLFNNFDEADVALSLHSTKLSVISTVEKTNYLSFSSQLSWAIIVYRRRLFTFTSRTTHVSPSSPISDESALLTTNLILVMALLCYVAITGAAAASCSNFVGSAIIINDHIMHTASRLTALSTS